MTDDSRAHPHFWLNPRNPKEKRGVMLIFFSALDGAVESPPPLVLQTALLDEGAEGKPSSVDMVYLAGVRVPVSPAIDAERVKRILMELDGEPEPPWAP